MTRRRLTANKLIVSGKRQCVSKLSRTRSTRSQTLLRSSRASKRTGATIPSQFSTREARSLAKYRPAILTSASTQLGISPCNAKWKCTVGARINLSGPKDVAIRAAQSQNTPIHHVGSILTSSSIHQVSATKSIT